jgi:hypothetical protein
MSFGLRNATQTFQCFMDDILRALHFCFAYLDDILVFSQSLEEHLRTLFNQLQRYGIIINPPKCVFRAAEVTCLSYQMSAKGSQPLDERETDLQRCQPPKTAGQLRRFLGMVNLYRQILPHAAATKSPLHDVLSGPRVKGSDPITWTSELLKGLDECKERLSWATLLTHTDPSAPPAIVTDASTPAMGAVIQQHVNDAWQPFAFSKKLNPDQQKYSSYDRELLAIYEAVEHFRHMLEAHHFTIFTDHKPITYAIQQKQDKSSPRGFNHLNFVAQFTTDIRYISGKDNVDADAISRVKSVTAPHHMTHWPHRRTVTTSSKHSWAQPPLCGWRNYQSPAPRSPSTVTPLPGDLDRTFQHPYGSKYSSPSMICRTWAPEQQQNWSRNASYGRACRRIAAPGHVLVRPASAPKSPVTR